MSQKPQPRRAARSAAHLAALTAVASGVVAASAPQAWARPFSAAVGAPPSSTATAVADPRLIQVKFRDDTAVTATGATLELASDAAERRIERIVGGAKSVSIEPVFKISESMLDKQRRRLQDRSKTVPDLTAWVKVQIAENVDPAVVLKELRQDPLVQEAGVVPVAAPPPATPDFTNLQAAQFSASPSGIGVAGTSSIPGILGDNVRVVDMEQGINLNHEDLVRTPATVKDLSPSGTSTDDHGTAVASIIAAKRDGVGIDGIAPHVDYGFYNENVFGRATGIVNATQLMAPGDVLVLEMQTWGPQVGGQPANYVPAEWDPAVYDATRVAVASGIIVVAAAGNGGQNLDAPEFANSFAQGKPDSGAILVGSGSTSCGTAPPRSRFTSSTYGARVNVQGPGECIPAAGYAWNGSANTYGGSDADPNNDYWFNFNSTSGATAVAGGVVAALSSAFEAANGAPLSPEAARHSLIQSGAAQVAATTDPPGGAHVGPLVNLAGAHAYLAAAPNTSVTAGPTGYTSVTQPAFTFTSPTAGVTYQCRIVKDGASAPAWGACSGATTHQPAAALANGDYRFEVRAKSGANFDPTPATRSFGVVANGVAVQVSSGTQLSVAALAGQVNNVTVRQSGSTLTVEDSLNDLLAGTGCVQVTLRKVTCTSASINFVSANMGDLNDVLDVDTPQNSFLNGGDGDDVLRGVGTGTDTFGGGNGNDTASYAGVAGAIQGSLDTTSNDGPVSNPIDFIGANTENVTGGNGNDTLTGGSNFARLRGGPGNDAISAGTGGANLDGGTGSDTLTGGASSNDRVDNSSRSEDLSFNTGSAGSVTVSSLGEADTLGGAIEEFAGGSGDDSFHDGPANEKLFGNGGADDLVAVAGGNDVIDGGADDDSIVDGAGDDISYGGDGNDSFVEFASSGSDEFWGGSGTADAVDYHFFSTGISLSADDVKNDGVQGLAAQLDNIHSDVELLEGGSGSDTLTGSASTRGLTGNNGNDTFLSPAGGGEIQGGLGVDKVDFSGRAAGLTLKPLNPVAETMYVNPVGGGFIGLRAIDHVVGSPYADTLVGGSGDPADQALTLEGGLGNDSLVGGANADTLLGGGGLDTLQAGGGDDSLFSKDSLGGESLTCGAGSDTVNADTTDTFPSGAACETVTY